MSRCPWCMSELHDEGACPNCGKLPMSYVASAHHLPPMAYLRDGRYCIGKVLGEGGFGITYVGYDEQLARLVAIKEYFPLGYARRFSSVSLTVESSMGGDLSLFADGRNKFLEEAQTMARVSSAHECLASVIDYFAENGTAYIIMEYVRGKSLAQISEDYGGKIPYEDLMQVIGPVLDALEAMHNTGLVHRDISPDNIMVGENGVRLIDFGCARVYLPDADEAAAGAADGEPGSTRGVREMTVMLKYDYAAPEQYGKTGQGPWSDVYGISATMYRCLCGKVPPRAIDRMTGTRLVPPSENGVELPESADKAIVRGLEPAIEDRFNSVGELRDALEGKKPVAKSNRPPMAAIIAAVCIVVVAVIAVVSTSSQGSSTAVTQAAPTMVISREEAAAEGRRLSAGEFHTMLVQEDGTVRATGITSRKDDQGQANVSRWSDIVEVSAGLYHSVGLKADGTLATAGLNDNGQLDVLDWNVTSVACGQYHTLGLKADGTVVATGWTADGRTDVSGWTDIVAVAAGEAHSVGLKADGTVVATGYGDQGQLEVSEWTDIVQVAAGMCHTVGLRSDGTVVATAITQSENDYGQCDVDGWTDVVSISCGRRHTIALKSDGTMLACGLGDGGKCNVSGWHDVVACAAGANHTVALTAEGTLNASGQSSEGQCDVDALVG